MIDPCSFVVCREGDALRVIDEKALQEARRWDNMSVKEKIGDWAMRRQYSLIMGGWATSLGVAAAIISRNKYQTFAQKVYISILLIWGRSFLSGLLFLLDCTSSYVGSRLNNRIIDRCRCTHTWPTAYPSRRGINLFFFKDCLNIYHGMVYFFFFYSVNMITLGEI